jgi:hypothetical protein
MLIVIKNIFNRFFNDERILSSQSIYRFDELLGYINSSNHEVKEISSDTVLENIAFISIETNNYKGYDALVGENIDVFTTLYKNDKASEFIFYNANNSEYIKLLDDRCYVQYYEGAEFTEGNLEINFPKIVDSSINKIEVGLGIYDKDKHSSLSLSNRLISDVVITLRHDNILHYSIKKNSIINDIRFCNFLTFYRESNKWHLLTEQKEFKSVAEFYEFNFTNISLNNK